MPNLFYYVVDASDNQRQTTSVVMTTGNTTQNDIEEATRN